MAKRKDDDDDYPWQCLVYSRHTVIFTLFHSTYRRTEDRSNEIRKYYKIYILSLPHHSSHETIILHLLADFVWFDCSSSWQGTNDACMYTCTVVHVHRRSYIVHRTWYVHSNDNHFMAFSCLYWNHFDNFTTNMRACVRMSNCAKTIKPMWLYTVQCTHNERTYHLWYIYTYFNCR